MSQSDNYMSNVRGGAKDQDRNDWISLRRSDKGCVRIGAQKRSQLSRKLKDPEVRREGPGSLFLIQSSPHSLALVENAEHFFSG